MLFLTLPYLQVQEVPLLIPPLAHTADECLKGLIQRELKIRLLIFITCRRPAWKKQTESPWGFRVLVSNGKWLNAPNELFLTVDTAWKKAMRREKGLGGREIHRVQGQEKVSFVL